MRREKAVSILHEHLAELRAFAVKRLALFGSVARGEAKPGSDVDILVEFDGPATFDRYTGLLARLEDLLGCRVDRLTPNSLKPRARADIERELVRVA